MTAAGPSPVALRGSQASSATIEAPEIPGLGGVMGEQGPHLLSLGSLPGRPSALATLAGRHPSLSLDPARP